MEQTMMCPRCGTPLTEGRTATDMKNKLLWLPVHRDLRFLEHGKAYREKKDLDEPLYLARTTVETHIHPAWYCTGCDLFLVDCKTELDEDFRKNPRNAK